MKKTMRTLMLSSLVLFSFSAIIFSFAGHPAYAGGLGNSVGKTQEIDDGGASFGSSGGRNVLGSEAGRKEMFDGARSASIKGAYYWVSWPYLYTNKAVSRKNRSYNGAFKVYDFRSNQHLNSSGTGFNSTGAGMAGAYNDILDFNYDGFTITADGLKTMGGSTQLLSGISPAGAYRIDHQECSQNFNGTCFGYKYFYTIYWVK